MTILNPCTCGCGEITRGRYRRGHDPNKLTEVERFWAKVNKDGPVSDLRPDLGACWIWTAACQKNGYSVFSKGSGRENSQQVRGHRYSYELAYGPIPDGLEIDHLCGNRPCVNPSHLEAVTHQENMLRGNTVAARNASRTHCPAGHPYEGDNLVINIRGDRGCRVCSTATNRKAWHKKRTAQCR